jgi:myosin-5
MRYFASVDHSDARMSEVEEQVMATNPVMEAFGNAKTIRNNNSSRFGKYIEIHFNKDTKITGASIRTYLLERSRVIFQAEDERNYHIFYQLCAGIATAERKNLRLSSWESYYFLSQGGDGVIEGVNDAVDFSETQTSLSKIGMSVSDQWKIFKLLAAILHLGIVENKTKQNKTNKQPLCIIIVWILISSLFIWILLNDRKREDQS